MAKVVVVETGTAHAAGCFADGFQMITGCTFGKGNIKQLGYGKFGLTLVDTATGRAVRVVPVADAQVQMKRTPFFQNRMKGVPASKVPEELVDPLIEQVLSTPEEQVFNVSEVFDYAVGPAGATFHTFICDRCGEMVVEGYGRPFEGQKLCQPCYDKAMAKKN